jgi:hypothetical protein
MDYEFDAGPDYRGRLFSEFYVRRDPATGPGWYIFGRNRAAGAMVVKLCARPDVSPRRHSNYNISVRRGWRTMCEAAAIAAWLNVSRRTK